MDCKTRWIRVGSVDRREVGKNDESCFAKRMLRYREETVSDFARAVRDEAARTREVDLTVLGRKTGRPLRVTLWIWGDDQHMYVRAGGGLRQDWPRNLIANPRAILHLSGRDIPVQARRVTEPEIARAGAGLIKRKYGADVAASREGEPLVPAEEATFELVPASSYQ